MRIQENNAIQEQLFFYIAPDVEKNNNRVSLAAAVDSFLDYRKTTRVFLLKGSAGAGKSLSLLHLNQSLLEKRRKDENEPMPIYVDLKRFNTQTVENSFSFVLKEKYHLDPKEIQNGKVLLLMDGYDEIAGGCEKNLYQCQNMKDWPKLKMIISCRTQYLASGYQKWFEPARGGFEELELLPFTDQQIGQYLKQYVETGNRDYTLIEYQNKIKNIPNLGRLITNPFILRILIGSLPELDKHIGQKREVTRYDIYEAFMKSWFVKQERRLAESSGILGNTDAIDAFEDFSKRLALTLHVHNQVEIRSDDSFWESYFSDHSPEAIKVRSGCPLQRIGDQCYSFIHKSFLEYFSSKAILEGVKDGITTIQPSHIVQEQSVIEFIKDVMEINPTIKFELLDQVKGSKNKEYLGKSAANTITLLNCIGYNFSGLDFNSIHIPQAILDDGMFDTVNFAGANLQGVSFHRAWLNKASFKDAQMQGVSFGERPYLKSSDPIESCCYSPDGQLLAVTKEDCVVLYNNETLTQIRTLEGHQDRVNCVVFSPDGLTIASAGLDQTIRLWRFNSSAGSLCLRGHANQVRCIAFSPDSQLLASGSEDNTIRLWKVANGQEKLLFIGHTDLVQSVAFSPDGQILTSGSNDQTVRLWKVSTGEEILCLEGHTNWVCCVAISPDGEIVASGSGDETIRLWKISTGNELLRLSGHTNYVKSIAFSPDGHTIVSGSEDRTIRLWKVSTGKEWRCLSGHTDDVSCVTFNPDGYTIASASYDRTVRLWKVNTDKGWQSLSTHTGFVQCATFSPDGQIVASASHDKTIHIWRVSNGKELLCLTGHTGFVQTVAFSPDGQTLASGSVDKTVRLWRLSTGEEIGCLKGHTNFVHYVTFSPNSQMIASAGLGDNTIHLWKVNSDREWKRLSGHQSAVYSVSFSPDGEILVSTSHDKTIRLWKVSTGEELVTLKGHKDWIHCAAFSPDGKVLASGSHDKTVKLWKINNGTGSEWQCLTGYNNEVNHISFSPDGQVLATSTHDKTIRIWKVSSGKVLLEGAIGCSILDFSWLGSRLKIMSTFGSQGSFSYWEVETSDARPHLRLVWSVNHTLMTRGLDWENAKGLLPEQIQLLQQCRGL